MRPFCSDPQENNAVAVVDVEKAEVLEIYPLGVKDWASCGGLDASDKDGGECWHLTVYQHAGRHSKVLALFRVLKGGPFDSWGGAMVFLSRQTIFFYISETKQKKFSLVDQNKIILPPWA